jgi:hypothetical protein
VLGVDGWSLATEACREALVMLLILMMSSPFD